MRPIFPRSSLARQIGLHGFPSSNSASPSPVAGANIWIGRLRPISGACVECRRSLAVSAPGIFRYLSTTNHACGFRDSQSPPDGRESTSFDDPPSQKSPALPQKEFKNLPSEAERRRSNASKRFSATMDDLQSAVFTAGQRLNDLTGYSGIEALKKSIEEQETHVKACRDEVKSAKEVYQAAINRRSASQREVNELLQRKNAWTPSDLERFTELYRSDHANEQAESAAQERLSRAEQAAEEAQSQLARSILTRYHEEQIWSDKIRRASTWGTWGLVGFNVLLFIIVQLGLEPWKRRRLVGGFEAKVREVIQEENIRNALLHLQHQPTSSTEITENELENMLSTPIFNSEEAMDTFQLQSEGTASRSEDQVAVDERQVLAFVEPDKQAMPHPLIPAERQAGNTMLHNKINWLRHYFRQLCSDKPITLRQIDITTVALESAAAGAVLTGIIAFLIHYNR